MEHNFKNISTYKLFISNKLDFIFKILFIEFLRTKTINDDKDSIRRPEITLDAAKSKLIAKLRKPADSGIKSSEETFDFRDILEIYVPIYEARLIGPKKRIKILRIDAVRKKVL